MDTVTRSKIERAVAAGLRASIAVHGPISFELIGSASKRAAGEVVTALGDQLIPDTTEVFDLDAFDLTLEELYLQPVGDPS